MPLAERMLFYNLAMTAMVMLPSSTLSRATKAGAPYLALFWRDVGNLTNLDAAYLPTKKRREMWDIRETGYRITT